MGFGQEMDGCGRFMKFGLFITNICTFIAGLVVFAIAVYMLIDRTYMNELLGTNIYAGTIYILVVMGALIVIISIFGCLGAIKEVKCLLLMYNIVVLIIFVTMLVGGILGYVFREKIKTTLDQDLHSSLKYYGNRVEVTEAWDHMQENLMCCGIKDYRDWQDKIPESCCREVLPGRELYRGSNKLPCTQNPSEITMYTDGCQKKAVEFMQENGVILGTAGIVVALLMVFGIIFSCVLFIKIE